MDYTDSDQQLLKASFQLLKEIEHITVYDPVIDNEDLSKALLGVPLTGGEMWCYKNLSEAIREFHSAVVRMEITQEIKKTMNLDQ